MLDDCRYGWVIDASLFPWLHTLAKYGSKTAAHYR